MNHSARQPFALAAAILCVGSGVLAGDTNPPPGPITGTMKPLSAVEPRTCISELPGAPNALHTITEPGNYVLTGDLVAPSGMHAILIVPAPGADPGPIIIDLNGFSISGSPGSLDGIRAMLPPPVPAAALVAVVIITGFAPDGASVHSFDGEAIHIENADSVSLSGLNISNCGGDGVHIAGDPDRPVIISLQGMHITGCLGDGIEVLASKKLFVGNLSIAECAGHGVSLQDVSDASIENVDTDSNAGHGMFSTYTPDQMHDILWNCRRCSATSNALDGFHVEAMQGSCEVDIDECSASGNGARGVSLSADASASCWIRVSQSHANTNGGSGLGFFLPATSSASLTLDGCNTNANGQAGDLADGSGIDVLSNMGGGGRIAIDYVNSTSMNNLVCGAIMKTFHDTAKAIISNVRAIGNGGSGIDSTGSDLQGIVVLCADNGAHGMRIEGGSVDLSDGRSENNAIDGIQCSDSWPCKWKGWLSAGNGGDGISAGLLAAPYIPGGVVVSAACSATGNIGAGLRVSGFASASIDGGTFSGNGDSGLTVEPAGPACATVAHVRNCAADTNGSDGFSIYCASGGRVIECSASSNTGAGLRIGGGPGGLATHLMIDRCVATGNAEGFVIADTENYVLRCTAMANVVANMNINPGNAAGPSSSFGGWDETKPYAWP